MCGDLPKIPFFDIKTTVFDLVESIAPLDLESRELSGEESLYDDLNFDSLSLLEFITSIEELFDFDDLDLEECVLGISPKIIAKKEALLKEGVRVKKNLSLIIINDWIKLIQMAS